MNLLAFLLPVVLATPPKTAAEAPALPAASLALHVEPSDGPGPWKLVVTNTSAKQLRFAADGRLLRFELENPDYDPEHPLRRQKKTGRVEPRTLECKLPPSMRPTNVAEERALYLAPGARYEESFYPDLYCFGSRERRALGPGTKVTPILGFAAPLPPKKGTPVASRPPFVAEPVGGPSSGLGPVKEIAGDSFTVPSQSGSTSDSLEDSSSAAGASPADSGPSDQSSSGSSAGSTGTQERSGGFDPQAPRLELSTPARIDAFDADHVELTVTVRNLGKRSALVRLRRDNLVFDVIGPNGQVVCGAGPSTRNIPTDLLTPLPGGASDSLVVRMIEPCPNDTFAQPGLYWVRARLLLKPSSGGAGQRALTGETEAKRTTLLRVQTGTRPFYSTVPVSARPEVIAAPSL